MFFTTPLHAFLYTRRGDGDSSRKTLIEKCLMHLHHNICKCIFSFRRPHTIRAFL